MLGSGRCAESAQGGLHDRLRHVPQHLGRASAQVDLFVDATGDHQWIHIDPARAAHGPFGGTIAHGYLTLSLAPVAIAGVLEIRELTAALNYGLNKVRFPAPVPVGAKVRTAVTLNAAQRKSSGIEAIFGLTYEIDGNARPACVADVVVLYP
nr:MaoC family dehydratase [Nocardia tengchongensis]